MEFLVDSQYISFYIDNIYPNGLAIDIPTWLFVGVVGLVYSIRLLRKDKQWLVILKNN